MVDERTSRIMVGHYRTGLERVDVPKRKISDVLDLLPTEITPEERATFEVALRYSGLSVRAQIQHVVKNPGHTGYPRTSPIDTFLTTGMIRHQRGIMSKQVPESFQSMNGLLPSGRMMGGVMKCDLESVLVQIQEQLKISRIFARGPAHLRGAVPLDGPHRFRGS